MDLELPDGHVVIFERVAFVPVGDGRAGEGESFALPRKGLDVFLRDDAVFVGTPFLVDPEEPLGVEQVFDVDGDQVFDVVEDHLFEVLVGDFGFAGGKELAEIEVAGVRGGLADLGRAHFFPFVRLDGQCPVPFQEEIIGALFAFPLSGHRAGVLDRLGELFEGVFDDGHQFPFQGGGHARGEAGRFLEAEEVADGGFRGHAQGFVRLLDLLQPFRDGRYDEPELERAVQVGLDLGDGGALVLQRDAFRPILQGFREREILLCKSILPHLVRLDDANVIQVLAVHENGVVRQEEMVDENGHHLVDVIVHQIPHILLVPDRLPVNVREHVVEDRETRLPHGPRRDFVAGFHGPDGQCLSVLQQEVMGRRRLDGIRHLPGIGQ